jgi:hypothetical protein
MKKKKRKKNRKEEVLTVTTNNGTRFDRIKYRMCISKVRHTILDNAITQAVKVYLRRSYKNASIDHSNMGVYECPFCKGFHIGNLYPDFTVRWRIKDHI